MREDPLDLVVLEEMHEELVRATLDGTAELERPRVPNVGAPCPENRVFARGVSDQCLDALAQVVGQLRAQVPHEPRRRRLREVLDELLVVEP